MRGDDEMQGAMFSYISPEQRVPQDHPLRPIRTMVEMARGELSPLFAALDSRTGGSVDRARETAPGAAAAMFNSIRSERLLMEQLNYNLLFRWFVGLNMDDPVWQPTVYSKNRDRLLRGEIAQAFLQQVVEQARERDLLSNEHFTVDGTLIEARASESRHAGPAEGSDIGWFGRFGQAGAGFSRGEAQQSRGAGLQSTGDPEARLYKERNGQEAKLAYLGHVLTLTWPSQNQTQKLARFQTMRNSR